MYVIPVAKLTYIHISPLPAAVLFQNINSCWPIMTLSVHMTDCSNGFLWCRELFGKSRNNKLPKGNAHSAINGVVQCRLKTYICMVAPIWNRHIIPMISRCSSIASRMRADTEYAHSTGTCNQGTSAYIPSAYPYPDQQIKRALPILQQQGSRRTMHGFGPELIMNPVTCLVETRLGARTRNLNNSWFNCPACRTALIATRFWVVVICPIIKCLTVLEFYFILFDLCLFITIFNFILNYVPIVTFWIFTYHKIWILLIIFCFIWSYWIIYFLTCLSVVI